MSLSSPEEDGEETVRVLLAAIPVVGWPLAIELVL